MKERSNIVGIKGKPLTLLGSELKVGDEAPDFEVVSNDLLPVKLSSFKGKALIVSSVPSLDTPVCDLETKRFNREAEKLGEDIGVLTISMDLPFAQKRWCGAADVKNVQTLSDHKDGSFGIAYGVLIKELRLLARAIFVIDDTGIVRYIQIVDDITNEPNYEEVLNAAKRLINKGGL